MQTYMTVGLEDSYEEFPVFAPDAVSALRHRFGELEGAVALGGGAAIAKVLGEPVAAWPVGK
jgi:hypothetical protein